ncbi:hypothetical protein D5F01_LYC18033 [Larimichthys crocea]|uniref:Uncharacterized protein n=1 Tax=Larimichthys crocea TaxID=215358 RepID=A0A6G0HFC3_LARCR|nr:hypothetical protein D5F01_LYC24246 [Larimichthys crocea]KAE8282646.1 hypothetical protein D5F01_LYC18033 [Larimichthys crocea]
MYGRSRDEGWTVVSYRRDRLRRPREERPRRRSPEYRFHHRHEATGQRRSYASVVRGHGRQGGYPQRYHHHVEHGYRPQFFVPGGHMAPKKQPVKYFTNQNTRYTTQDTGRNTHRERREGNREENKPQSSDPDFGIKIRTIHTIIKIAHHLNNVDSDKPPPPTIQKLTEHLITTIKPASPNEETKLLIEGNAKNWEHTTMLILRDHYTDSLEKELLTLKGLSKGEWRGPFQIATVWAKRNLGRRLRSETLEQVEAFMVAELEPTMEREKERGPDSPPPPRPPVTKKQKTQVTTKHDIKAFIHTERVNADLKTRGEALVGARGSSPPAVPETPAHSPPPVQVPERARTPSRVDTATMTVETGGWSPPQEGNIINIMDTAIPQEPPPHLTPAASVDLLPQSPPKPQRSRRSGILAPEKTENQNENLPGDDPPAAPTAPTLAAEPVLAAVPSNPAVAYTSDSITCLSS